MKIDFSAASAFAFCPAAYQEKYQQGWRSKGGKESLDFGSRIHNLLKGHFSGLKGNEGILGPQGEAPQVSDGEALTDVALENEALEMFEMYKSHYPVEDFEVIDVERYFEVPLPDSEHILCGKWDGIISRAGHPGVFEHKTEKRGGKGNLPQSWAARNQVGLYIWAAGYIYERKFDFILLDVLTRRSPAGRVPCTFRRDTLQRSPQNMERCTEWITGVADDIQRYEDKFGSSRLWPQNGDNCNRGGWACDFYGPHVVSECQVVSLEELVRNKCYERAEDYLHT